MATTLLLRRFGPAMVARAANPAGVLALIARIALLEPPQTRRDDVQQRFQQFSTPLELAWCVAACAGVTARDVVLEPSAGTGTLAAAAALGLERRRRRTPGAQRAHEHPRRPAAAWRSPTPT